MSLPSPSRRRRLWRNLFLLISAGAFSTTLLAQGGKPGKPERREMKKDPASATGGKFNPEDAQSRGMTKLREQFEVTDDDEWNVIVERLTKVGELRRSQASGGAGLRGSPSIGETSKRTGRADASAHPEQDALRTAVRDKLPDAEIKARLARVHDVHRQNEAKLTRAQEELRAVLTVRQEAVAVMAGLLPP